MSKSNTTIGENKYGKYCVPLSATHRREVKIILEGGVHEQDTIDFILENCEHELIHAGTYFGDMLPAFGKNLEKVWAFEPSPEAYECASETIRLNDLNNVVLTNAGLGAKSSKAQLLAKDKKGRAMGSAGKIVGGASRDTVSINVTTIDESVPLDSNISLIHLDVEYHEMQAVRGALKTIERCSPILILETKRGQEPKYKKVLEPMGYKIIGYTHPSPALPHGVNSIWSRN